MEGGSRDEYGSNYMKEERGLQRLKSGKRRGKVYKIYQHSNAQPRKLLGVNPRKHAACEDLRNIKRGTRCSLVENSIECTDESIISDVVLEQIREEGRQIRDASDGTVSKSKKRHEASHPGNNTAKGGEESTSSSCIICYSDGAYLSDIFFINCNQQGYRKQRKYAAFPRDKGVCKECRDQYIIYSSIGVVCPFCRGRCMGKDLSSSLRFPKKKKSFVERMKIRAGRAVSGAESRFESFYNRTLL